MFIYRNEEQKDKKNKYNNITYNIYRNHFKSKQTGNNGKQYRNFYFFG